MTASAAAEKSAEDTDAGGI